MYSHKWTDVDKLKLYFMEPCNISESITVYQPTIGDITEYGEREFYSILNNFIGNTTMYRLQLWEVGIDWNKITDYELFRSFIPFLTPDKTRLLFGDLDFSKFEEYQKTIGEETSIILYDPINKIEINEIIYSNMALYLRTMFGIFPKNEFAKGKATKEAMIWEDKENIKNKQNEEYQSTLFPLVSACCNHPGFKYRSNELKQIGIFEFMDSVQRLQIYESTTALLKGMYSGFCDTSKIEKEQFDFMRSVENGKPKYPKGDKPNKSDKDKK